MGKTADTKQGNRNLFKLTITLFTNDFFFESNKTCILPKFYFSTVLYCLLSDEPSAIQPVLLSRHGHAIEVLL